MTEFRTLNLSNRIMRAIEAEGYETATPIQAQTIPPLLEGRDVMGVAQTGTGKTASFALPLLHGLAENTAWAEARKPKALILAPTRELAVQIHDSIKTYGKGVKMRSTVVFGGSSIRAQMKAMDRGVHILVATPGRLMDLFNQGYVKFSEVETFILDEADRMLDMGFIKGQETFTARGSFAEPQTGAGAGLYAHQTRCRSCEQVLYPNRCSCGCHSR